MLSSPGLLNGGVVPDTRGGFREGAGRKPNWVRLKCQDIIVESKILEFLAGVARGEEKDFKVSHLGKIVSVPVSVKDRIDACRELLDRGVGKAQTFLDMSIIGNNIIVKFDNPSNDHNVQA